VRGHGLTIAYLHCIHRAIEDNVTAAYFFEDDGRLATPQASTAPGRLCGQAGRDAFAMTLPEDALAVFIGAHHKTFLDAAAAQSQVRGSYAHRDRDGVRFRPTSDSSGTYGWVIPGTRLALFRDFFTASLVAVASMGPRELPDNMDANVFRRGVLRPDRDLYGAFDVV